MIRLVFLLLRFLLDLPLGLLLNAILNTSWRVPVDDKHDLFCDKHVDGIPLFVATKHDFRCEIKYTICARCKGYNEWSKSPLISLISRSLCGLFQTRRGTTIALTMMLRLPVTNVVNVTHGRIPWPDIFERAAESYLDTNAPSAAGNSNAGTICCVTKITFTKQSEIVTIRKRFRESRNLFLLNPIEIRFGWQCFFSVFILCFSFFFFF